MSSKKIIITAVILSALLIVGAFGAGVAVAKTSDKSSTIIEKLADRFNVGTDEVKEVFNEARQERRQQAQADFEEKLDEAVKEGKLTKVQKETILKKHSQIQKKQEELMELRQELWEWAEENDVDLRSIMPGRRGGQGGPGGPGGFGLGPGMCQ